MKEKRYISEIRSVDGGENSRHIEGYALLFNVRSVQLGDFSEVIMPSALNDEILKRSDILALLNHDITRGVLARSKYGQGSLTLTIDEKGLKYEFDAPNTALGDELIEGIRRGDIANSSFSFLVKRDEWQQTPEGGYLRIIHEFDQLFDISPVYQPAYDETTVDCRGLENLKNEIESRMTKDEETKEVEDEVKDEETKPTETEPQTEEPAEGEENKSADPDENECRADEEPEGKEENEPADTPADEEKEEKEDEPKQDEKRNTNIAMSKKFSLINAINQIANGQPLDEAAAKVNAEGRSAMIESGLTPNGQLVLGGEVRSAQPEQRANGIFATVENQGAEAVPTDTLDILAPLRARLVAAQSGATFMSGLVGNITLPRYSGSTANWKGEVAKADNGEGTFDEISLTPKRLTSVVEVSRQFLVQTSPSANAMLQADIVNSIADKLEATMFSADPATANKPAGLFVGVTADTAAVKFDDILTMEQELEEANVYGNLSYVASPAAKATLRGTVIGGTGSGRFLMESNEIQGLNVLSTSNVVKNGLILGQWNDLVIAQWSGIDLVVDTVTKADEGIVRLVINSYWDFKTRRDESFVKRILK
ncbi:MAG: HK97 family phage prohead protease [Ruminococcaceae bacterium]|nr:HK97 family phage prohead protease [Oscillospiraceae bacterium]